MKVPLLDLRAQYEGIRDEVQAAMGALCESQQFILGKAVETFEQAVAEYCGASHAVGVSSGSDALLVGLMAFGVGPGDAVITTPYTFFATVGAIARLGARAVLVDIDQATYNMDAGQLRALLDGWDEGKHGGTRPKAVIPVHLFGQCADMEPILEAARAHGLRVIEDAAQAIGSDYPSAGGARRAGTIGDLGCFSFFPSKNLGGFGDGGLVTAGDAELAEMVRILRGHGSKPKYYHRYVGGNFRLDALQAVVLGVKLKRLEQWHAARREHARRYDEAFRGTAVEAPRAVYEGSGVSNWHIYNQYVVRVPGRDAVKAALKAAEIGCEVYYPLPLHLQECFQGLGYREGDFPQSERAASETLALPVYPELTEEMQAHVIDTLLGAVRAD